MHVISKAALVKFWNGLPEGPVRAAAQRAMTEWLSMATNASWSKFADVKETFNTADYVGAGKVVFDVGGNKYRIVGLIGWKSKRIFVLFVGTHREYDRIDVTAL